MILLATSYVYLKYLYVNDKVHRDGIVPVQQVK